jgi:hypothetical protein
MSKTKQESCDKPVACNQHEDIILSKIRHIEENIDELMKRKKRPSTPSPSVQLKKQRPKQYKCVRHPWFTLSNQCQYKKRHKKRRCPHQMPSLFSYAGNFCWTKP